MKFWTKVKETLVKVDKLIDKADSISTEYCCKVERKCLKGKTIDEHISTNVPVIINKVKNIKVRETVSRASKTVSSTAKTVSTKAKATVTKTTDVVKCAPAKIKTMTISAIATTVSTVVADAVILTYRVVRTIVLPTCIKTIGRLVRVSK